jgi:hypothetical protein
MPVTVGLAPSPSVFAAAAEFDTDHLPSAVRRTPPDSSDGWSVSMSDFDDLVAHCTARTRWSPLGLLELVRWGSSGSPRSGSPRSAGHSDAEAAARFDALMRERRHHDRHPSRHEAVQFVAEEPIADTELAEVLRCREPTTAALTAPRRVLGQNGGLVSARWGAGLHDSETLPHSSCSPPRNGHTAVVGRPQTLGGGTGSRCPAPDRRGSAASTERAAHPGAARAVRRSATPPAPARRSCMGHRAVGEVGINSRSASFPLAEHVRPPRWRRWSGHSVRPDPQADRLPGYACRPPSAHRRRA